MVVAIHQPHYLPWLGYFDKIDQSDIFVILDNVQYKKREYQNRNRIKTPSGAIWLTVPVLTRGRYAQTTGEVRIDSTVDWLAKHLKALSQNYRKALYFEQYYPALENLYMERNRTLLPDLNAEMLRFFLALLGIRVPVRFESELAVSGVKTERIANICLALGADTYLSGAGAKDYLDDNLFEKAGLKLRYQEFEHPVYPQLYGEFLPYMAVVDLLFNCGDRSLEIIRRGRKTT